MKSLLTTKFLVALVTGVLAAAVASLSPAQTAGPDSPPATFSTDQIGHVYAEIETSKGNIEAELDFQRAPLTAMNFVGLAEGTLPFQNRPANKPFFDGLTFHRVVKDFVIQGGDPLSADPATPADKLGDGGPGYSFPDEFSPGLRHNGAGRFVDGQRWPGHQRQPVFHHLARGEPA